MCFQRIRAKNYLPTAAGKTPTHTYGTTIQYAMGIFTDCLIALELDSSLGFKKKSALKGKIIDNGGTISFIVTKNVSCTSIAIWVYTKAAHMRTYIKAPFFN